MMETGDSSQRFVFVTLVTSLAQKHMQLLPKPLCVVSVSYSLLLPLECDSRC